MNLLKTNFSPLTWIDGFKVCNSQEQGETFSHKEGPGFLSSGQQIWPNNWTKIGVRWHNVCAECNTRIFYSWQTMEGYRYSSCECGHSL